MEKIQILSEIVDNRSFVKMSKGKRNRTYRNRNKNKEKQKNSMLKSFNYAENVPKEIWMKVFFYCDQISLDNLKMTCVAFYNIIDSNAAQYGISSTFNCIHIYFFKLHNFLVQSQIPTQGVHSSAQWSSLVLERHFLILFNLFNFRLLGLKISIRTQINVC